MTDFSDIKEGDRVRLVYEFTLEAVSADRNWIASKAGEAYYKDDENGKDLVSVEKIAPPLPTEDGWYESERFPLSDGCSPYELRGGDWYEPGDDNRLAENYVSKFLAPLYRLGRVDG